MTFKRSLTLRYFPVNDQVEERFLLVFHHNTINSNFFNSYSEFLSTDSIDKYSILGFIDDDFKIDNSFEFIMEYPETSKYAHWKQDINPLEGERNEITCNIIDKTWNEDPTNPFVCLHKSERINKTYVEGTEGLSSQVKPQYYYSIGLRETWYNNHLPAYISSPTTSNIHEVFLWLKITDLNLLKKIRIITCIYHKTSLRKYVFVFLLLNQNSRY